MILAADRGADRIGNFLLDGSASRELGYTLYVIAN